MSAPSSRVTAEKITPGTVSEMPWHNGDGYSWGGDVIVSIGTRAINLGSSTLYNEHEEIRALAALIAASPDLLQMLKSCATLARRGWPFRHAGNQCRHRQSRWPLMIPRSMDKTASRVSDERLAEIDNDACDQMAAEKYGWCADITADEAHSIVTELQSLRSLSDSVSDGSKGVSDALIGYLWQEICELPDRSSPEEYPDMALVTLDELTAIVETFFERQHPSALDIGTGGQEPVADPLRERLARISEARAKLSPGEYPEEQPSPDGLYEPLYPSPTEPKARVVITDDMVERAARAMEPMAFREEFTATDEWMNLSKRVVCKH